MGSTRPNRPMEAFHRHRGPAHPSPAPRTGAALLYCLIWSGRRRLNPIPPPHTLSPPPPSLITRRKKQKKQLHPSRDSQPELCSAGNAGAHRLVSTCQVKVSELRVCLKAARSKRLRKLHRGLSHDVDEHRQPIDAMSGGNGKQTN